MTTGAPTPPAALPARHGVVMMGILNVTPDSFSDGGRWTSADAAVARGMDLAEQGADIVDIGGESTRPGAGRVAEEEELARVVPVVRRLSAAGVATSVDTTRAGVAQAAIDAGAVLINDVSGGLADPDMFPVVARAGVPYVLMHWRAPSDVMDAHGAYQDVVAEVRSELAARVEAFTAAGGTRAQLILDPGLGFAKDAQANWRLLGALDTVKSLGLPVLIGASRKRFIGELLASVHGSDVAPGERDGATAVLSALAVMAGAWGVRVHEIRPNLDAVAIAQAWRTAAAIPGETAVSRHAGARDTAGGSPR